jgi:hypothetical protein
MGNLPWNPRSAKCQRCFAATHRRVMAEDVRLPGSTGWREFRVARSRTSRDVEVADSACFWREKKARRIAPLQFVWVMRSRLPGSGRHFERWDVSEPIEKRVLIVVATARFDPPLACRSGRSRQKGRDILRPVGVIEPSGPSLVPSTVNSATPSRVKADLNRVKAVLREKHGVVLD